MPTRSSRCIPLPPHRLISFCAFVLWTASTGPVAAQRPSPSTAPVTLTPYLAAISVANIDSSSAWYRALLGFRVSRPTWEPRPGLRISFLIRDDFRLELIEASKSRPRSLALPDSTRDVSLQGITKLAFRVSDIEALATRLRQREVRFVFGPATDSVEKVRHFIVADPDGNLIQFFQPLHP